MQYTSVFPHAVMFFFNLTFFLSYRDINACRLILSFAYAIIKLIKIYCLTTLCLIDTTLHVEMYILKYLKLTAYTLFVGESKTYDIEQ